MKVAIVGSNGFVGKSLCRNFQKLNYEVFEVTRENYNEYKLIDYDFLINTLMPSKRFWALNYPVEDVIETIVKTSELFYKWKYKKFIHISTLSAKNDTNTPYGSHKRASEVLVQSKKNTLIVRLGALYGKGLDKGALFDLINHNKIYVDIHSEYNYIDIDVATEWIVNNMNEVGTKEIGAYDTISLLDISKITWNNPIYTGRREVVYSEDIEKGMPSSREVLKYVRRLL
tara:strand:+ start:475 stop:1161 length:687 start_codon:yes stop_codon:yes gene_type:complete